MAFPISYRGIEGQSGLYAQVQRVLDGKCWDPRINTEPPSETGLWVGTASVHCHLPLTEDTDFPGYYQAAPTLVPAPEGIYRIEIYDADDVLLITSVIRQPAKVRTVLQLINDVQVRLRLPLSADLSGKHAKLLLSFLNQVLLDFMGDSAPWEPLKLEGQINFMVGQPLYLLSPPNVATLDFLDNLQIGTNPPIEKLSDEKFNNLRASYSAPGSPLFYRIQARTQNQMVIEVLPTPDTSYLADYRLYQKSVRLEAATDVPLVDGNTIFAGMLMLARQEQGEDYSAEATIFQAKLSLLIGNEAAPEWGDMEPV